MSTSIQGIDLTRYVVEVRVHGLVTCTPIHFLSCLIASIDLDLAGSAARFPDAVSEPLSVTCNQAVIIPPVFFLKPTLIPFMIIRYQPRTA